MIPDWLLSFFGGLGIVVGISLAVLMFGTVVGSVLANLGSKP